jgi:hypothetical protein
VTNPTQDQTAIIRQGAVTSLTTYGVVADGVTVPVESERVDPVEDGDLPRIVIFADDNGTTASSAGTAPAFDVTATFIVQALAQRAIRDDAVADIDTMVAQIKDCLLGDPVWVALSANIASVKVTRSFKFEGRRVLGDARVMIECTWKEIYPPRVTTPLVTVTQTTNPPAGTQSIASGGTLSSS